MTVQRTPGLEYLLGLSSVWPLAVWDAWDNAEPATSQARTARALGTEVTAIFGGVRSGKTALGFEIDKAHALGGDHPAVRAWLERNRIPWTIPPGPGRVWVVAATWNDSIRIHRPNFVETIPAAFADWRNETGNGEARVFIEIPGYSKPGEIWFKSADQPVKAMKGDACRLIHFDEEPEQDRWDEASLRTGYQGINGPETLRMLLTMQPEGMTWVHREIVAKAKAPSVRCHWLDSLDNKALPEPVREQLRRKFAALPEARRLARQLGRFVQREGLVYPAFAHGVHVVAPRPIDPSWPRVLGIDFGMGITAVVFGAIDPDDGQIVIYDEHYLGGLNLGQHADAIRQRPGIVRGWGDPREVQQCAELTRQLKIKIRPPKERSVNLGIDAVTSRLHVGDGERRPGLVIFDTCKHLLWELERYHWPRGGVGTNPVKKDDHAVDALRYLVIGVDHWIRRGRAGGVTGIDSGQRLRQTSRWRV